MDAIFDREAFLTALRRCFDASGLNEYLKDGKEERYAFLCERLFEENKRYKLSIKNYDYREGKSNVVDVNGFTPLAEALPNWMNEYN